MIPSAIHHCWDPIKFYNFVFENSRDSSQNLKFIGPCIVIYSYSTTNKLHLFFKLFFLVKHSTCFGRSFRPSSGAQNSVYSTRYMSNSFYYLLQSGMRWIPSSGAQNCVYSNGICQTAAATCRYRGR